MQQHLFTSGQQFIMNSPYHDWFNGQEPNISYLRIFGYAVYVPISPPQRAKMRPQRRLGIYVSYESPSIIKYLELSTRNLFTTLFVDCHFAETFFLTLGEQKLSSW